jgi:ComF family protein
MISAELDPAIAQVLFAPEPPRRFRILHAGFATALDLVFPPHCTSCGIPLPPDVNKALCLACARKIPWIGSDRCNRCGDATGQGTGVVDDCPSCRTHPPRFIKAACAAARYSEGPLRHLILALKFSGRIHIAQTMGEILAKRIRDTGLTGPGPVLVPTPLTRQALHRRGFNQAHELALVAGKILGLKVETRLLRKIRGTAPQATLSHTRRRVNLNGAFACNAKVAKRYKDVCVLLVDDVITTGSTISECARTLDAAGIGQIYAAAIARG